MAARALQRASQFERYFQRRRYFAELVGLAVLSLHMKFLTKCVCFINYTKKAARPHGIEPRVLKLCAEQLCGFPQHIFNLSCSLKRVPVRWKTSCVLPVPNKRQPIALNDYRPVALTSHLLKTFEKLILVHLRPLVTTPLHPLQFAYQDGNGVDDCCTEHTLTWTHQAAL